MKNFIYTITLSATLLLAGCSPSEQSPAKNSLETANLNGNVKQVTEFYHPDGGAMIGAPSSQGEPIEIIRVTEYSPEGFITQVRTTAPNGSYSEKHNYDDKNKLTNVTFIVDSAVVQHTEFSYNRKGLKDSEKIYDKENKLVRENTFDYDKNGNISRVTTFNVPKNVSEKIDLVYDQNGYKISSKTYYPDGKVNMENKYTYNQYGDLATSTSSDKMMGGDYTQTYSYANYDNNKNWLARAITFQGNVVETIEREIEYYQK